MWKRVSFRKSCHKYFKGTSFETNVPQGLLKETRKIWKGKNNGI
jgi:hypothetical protein